MKLIIYYIFKIDIYPENLLNINRKIFGFIKKLLLIFNKKFIEFILIILE
jgi:hypothetical protein